MEVHFERLALYDEVWSTPLTKLGEKYGMSDNGIRKVCKTMDIPLPKVGYWARVQAGQVVTRTALPEKAGRTTFVCRPPPRPSLEFKRPEDVVWLEERLTSEQREDALITVDAVPNRWHTLLRPLRDGLISQVKAYDRMVKAREKENLRPSRSWEPNWDALSAMDFDGSLLYPRSQKTCFRVSKLTYERALAIANTLLLAAEARGCTVTYDDHCARPQINLERETFSFAIRERQLTEVVLVSETHPGIGTHKVGTPTDTLALIIDRRFGGTFEILDKGDFRVETRLNEVFKRLYKSVAEGREKRREHEATERRRAEFRATQDVIHRMQELEAKQKAEEILRREVLLAEATSWQHAQQIRAFVADVISRAETPPSAAHRDWASWALRVASEKDPVPGRNIALAHVREPK